MKLIKYIASLGTKASRTDIWVICIASAFLMCITGYIPCVANQMTMTIMIGMFADLGIKDITTIVDKVKQKETITNDK